MRISFAHAQRVSTLPRLRHKDPFDRLWISQSLEEGLAMLSADTDFDQYGVTRIWKRECDTRNG
jgi:PIN domain nuclease of toxin-antitoxin system